MSDIGEPVTGQPTNGAPVTDELMFIGGYEVLQTAVLVVSLPILGIGVLMSVALVKQLNADRSPTT